VSDSALIRSAAEYRQALSMLAYAPSAKYARLRQELSGTLSLLEDEISRRNLSLIYELDRAGSPARMEEGSSTAS
jgi:hypothetical protein